MDVVICKGGVGLTKWKDAPEDVVIPDHVKNGKPVRRLLRGCFEKSTIRSVCVGVNVEVIEGWAFDSSENLREVRFEDASSVKRIGDCAFHSCKSLVSFVWPGNVEEIPGGASMAASRCPLFVLKTLIL